MPEFLNGIPVVAFFLDIYYVNTKWCLIRAKF